MVTMKRHLTRIVTLAGVLVYGMGVGMPLMAMAATPSTSSSGQALEIAPPVITLSINPGQTVKSQVFLRDVSPSNVVVTSEVNDFVAAGEDGTPKIILKDEGANPYSVKGWISPPAQLQLAPHEVKATPVTITAPANAAPGGHYGIIRFTATAPELHGTGVALTASLGALVLITVNGPVKESLSVAQLSASHNGKSGSLFESAPITFTTRLKNSGNIHEQPVGQIVIKDMFGKKIAGVNVNSPPRNILPQSIRKFTSPLDSTVIGNKKLFGHYSADLSVTYGAKKQIATAHMGFWVIPYRLIIVIIVVLVGGFLILRAGIKRYNRRIITKAQQTPKNK